MSLDWRIEAGADEGARTSAERSIGGTRRAPGPRDRRGRPALRGALLLLAALAVGLFVALGLRAWSNHRLLRQAEADVRLAVELEEQALRDGDRELYLAAQDPERRRRLRAETEPRPPAPLPGLAPAAEPEIDAVRALPPGSLRGGTIREAEVRVTYPFTDAFGAGRFSEPRTYRRDEDGAWRHAAEPGTRRDLDALFEGQRIRASYAWEDEALLRPALAELDEALVAHCQALGCAEDRAVVLRVSGARPGQVRELHDGTERLLELPSPALTLAPADEAGRALFERQLLRVVASLAMPREGRWSNAFLPDESPWSELRAALLDAWLARREGRPVPVPSAGLPPVRDDIPPSAWDLWQSWNASDTGDRAWQRPAAQALASELVEVRGLDPLRLLWTMDRPDRQSLFAWLSGTLAPEEAVRLAAGWPETGGPRPYPMDEPMILRCFHTDGEGGYQGWPLLFQPGRDGALSLDQVLPTDGEESACRISWAAWSPDGASLALLCAPSEDAEPGAGRRLRIHDGQAPWTLRQRVEGVEAWSAEWLGSQRIYLRQEGGEAVLDLAVPEPRAERIGVDPAWFTFGREALAEDGRWIARLESEGPRTGAGPLRVALYDAARPERPLWTRAIEEAPHTGFPLGFDAGGSRLAWPRVLQGEEPELLVEVVDAATGAELARLRHAVPRAMPANPRQASPRFAGFDPGGAWLAVGLRGDPDAASETADTLGTLVAWRPDVQAAEGEGEEERVVVLPVPADVELSWLPEADPNAGPEGPSLLLYESRQLVLGGPRRTEPYTLVDVVGERRRRLVRMPAQPSPDEDWLWRASYGRFELRDREDRPLWAYHARGCVPQWRAARPTS